MFVREYTKNGRTYYNILKSAWPKDAKWPKHVTMDPDEAYKIALEDYKKAKEKLCLVDRIREQRRKRKRGNSKS